jgi:hypothetical protein
MRIHIVESFESHGEASYIESAWLTKRKANAEAKKISDGKSDRPSDFRAHVVTLTVRDAKAPNA